MSRYIPLFPLPLAVFPGELQPLHIFEPRYKQLFQDCRDGELSFGILPVAGKELATWGTEMRLVEVLKTHENGEMDVLTEGVGIFALDAFEPQAPGKLYPGGEVIDQINDPEVREETVETLRAVIDMLLKRIGATINPEELAPDFWSAPNLSYRLGVAGDLFLPQRLALLSRASEEARQQYLIDYINRILPQIGGKIGGPKKGAPYTYYHPN